MTGDIKDEVHKGISPRAVEEIFSAINHGSIDLPDDDELEMDYDE